MNGSEILIPFAASFMGKVLAGMMVSEEALPPPKPAVVVEEKIVVAKVEPKPIEVPSFVTHVPAGHFAGVSGPMETLAEARKFAISDVVRQVLSAIDISYSHVYHDRVFGNVHSAERVIDDRLSGVARGIVLGVEQGIVDSSYCRDYAGKHVYFVLVRYPESRIEEMRRFSKGAKVSASLVGIFEGKALLNVSEANGVGVILSSVEARVRQVNRNAGAISKFVWKVSKGTDHKYTVPLDSPIKICGTSRDISVPLKMSEKTIKEYFLGSKFEWDVSLKGHDEIGRHVAARVVF